MNTEIKKIGRPKGIETTLINFRAPLTTILAAKQAHGKQLNKRFNNWLKKQAKAPVSNM